MRMKFLGLSLAALSMYASGLCGIHTVSPNGTYPAQFSKVALAIQAAAAGDTILIYPGNVHEDIVLNKRLIIIGAGLNPKTVSKSPTTWSQRLNLNPGASGSAIMGIHFASLMMTLDEATVNNLWISECRFNATGDRVHLKGSNILIENCIFHAALNLKLAGAQNNVVRNCIFSSENQEGLLYIESGSNTGVLNNVFCSNTLNTSAILRSTHYIPIGAGVTVANNIFFRANPYVAAHNSELNYLNNIYYLGVNDIPGDPAVTKNVRANPKFVQYPDGGPVFNFGYNLNLLPDSPAKNWGTDGKDAGISGGLAPANAGFEPPLPRIYQLEASNATVPPGGTIQLKIQATKAQ
jgi:hypothetical protein